MNHAAQGRPPSPPAVPDRVVRVRRFAQSLSLQGGPRNVPIRFSGAVVTAQAHIWPLWVPGFILACYMLTYVPSTVGQMSRRWEIRSEINRLKVQRWTKHLHITDQQLECCASEVQSQDLEDMHILEILLLAAKHEGQKTFVELGALDGKTLSNTYMLERCFGWHGLLIEGSPQNFEKLKQNRPSPNNVLRNLAICPPRWSWIRQLLLDRLSCERRCQRHVS